MAKATKVNPGDSALASQYNNLVDDSFGASQLLAHEQTPPNLTLKVEKGVYYIGSTRVIFAGGNSPSFTAPTTNPRIDLLVIDSAGTLSRVVGTEAASPTVPTYPSDKLTICEVYNRVGQTAIRDTDTPGQGYILRDVRPFLQNAPPILSLYFTPSENLKNSNDTQKYTHSQTYVKLKEIKLNQDLPACRIKFDLEGHSYVGEQYAYARIYKNGVAIGTERSVYMGATGATTSATFSEDFTGFVKGDLIQLYAYTPGDGNAYAAVRNFRLYYDVGLGISTTNQDP